MRGHQGAAYALTTGNNVPHDLPHKSFRMRTYKTPRNCSF